MFQAFLTETSRCVVRVLCMVIHTTVSRSIRHRSRVGEELRKERGRKGKGIDMYRSKTMSLQNVMKKKIGLVSLELLAVIMLLGVSGCSVFGGGGDDMSEEVTDEFADSDQGTIENAFSNDSNMYEADSNYSDYGESTQDFTSDDSEEYSAMDEYSDDSLTVSADSAGMLSGSVMFVSYNTEVFNSPQGGSVMFTLAQGDTIKGDNMGDYTMIGEGQYVLTAALSQSLVARVPTANPWR